MNNFFNYLRKVFSQNKKPLPNPMQHDELEMKDELPLVNKGLIEIIEMRVFSIKGNSDYKIGDKIKLSLFNKEAEDGFKVVKYLEQKKIAKLKKDDVEIKVKEI